MPCREVSRNTVVAVNFDHKRTKSVFDIGLLWSSHRSWPSFSHGVPRGDADWHLRVPSIFNIQNAFKTLQPVVQMFRRHACTADGQAHELQQNFD